MTYRRPVWTAAILAGALGIASQAHAAGVFQEDDGLVVVEIESEPVAGDWVSETSQSGYTGSAYYRLNGNGYDTGPVNGILTYQVNITNAGTYRFQLRCSKGYPDDGTWSNDIYLRMVGHPGMQDDYNKVFGGSMMPDWGWANTYDVNHNKTAVTFELSAGEWELHIAGRSKGFRIDRFVLYNTALTSEAEAKNTGNPESPTSPIVNPPPIANAGPDQSKEDTDGDGVESFSLDGSGSNDDGSIAGYVWKEGSTQIATGQAPDVTLGVGSHTVTLTVTDDEGATSTDAVVLNVVNNLAPIAHAGADLTAQDDDLDDDADVTLDGSASHDPSSGGSIVSYVWSVGGTQVGTGANPTVTLGVGIHTVTLTVTDDRGLTGSDTVRVSVTFQDDDADGMADTWEIDHFGATSAAGALSDADDDGFTDLAEFLGSSDPLDPLDVPNLSGGQSGVSCSAHGSTGDASAAGALVSLAIALAAGITRRKRAIAIVQR